MKDWFTAREVAQNCMVSTATVRRWIKDGKLTAVKLPGRHYRIRLADYRDFLERYGMPMKEEPFQSES